MRSKIAIHTVDTHTMGQPTRTVIGGLPRIPGASMVEKMDYARRELDGLRRLLMLEPRGSGIMSGALLTEPCRPGCHLGVLFIEVGGFLPMCGHDAIGLCTALIETGRLPAREPETTLLLDTPAGPVAARARVEGGAVRAVTLENVPAFVAASGLTVEPPGLGEITLDVAFGGCFYAMVDVAAVGLTLDRRHAARLVQAGRAIRRAFNARHTVIHPENPALRGVTHVQFMAAPPADPGPSAVVIPDGHLDRSPCGTGTSARMALLHRAGRLAVGQPFVSESLLGSRFDCKIVGETAVGGLPAILPEITGSAWVTGLHTFFLEPDDPFPTGFTLAD